MTTPEQPEGTKEESSPIFDEISNPSGKTTTTTTTTTVTEPSTEEDNEVDESEEATETPHSAKSYKLDVQRALDRETHDGQGDEDPGPSDWNGYATEGVEVEDG